MQETSQFSELITIRDFLRFAVTKFGNAGLTYGHGTTNALDDAAFLILESLHLPIDTLEPWLDARLTRAERALIGGVIEARVVTRQPSSYITRTAYIGPHKFTVDTRVIVPRSFIGELLCAEIDPPLALQRPPSRVLDLCTGSGCLAIVAAHTFPEAQVTAVDISAHALEVADENIRRHNLSGRVQARPGDLFDALQDEKFDLILCNPPYVQAATVASFPPEHKAEPALAHDGGADGMDLVRRVIDGAGRHLATHGTLIVELGQGRAIIERDYPQLPFLWLDTEHGEGEVFSLEAASLQAPPKAGSNRSKPKAITARGRRG